MLRTYASTKSSAGGGSGTVTSVSVVSANGIAGSVATATTTPAITLTSSQMQLTIAQTAHGFSVGNAIRYNGTAYAKSQANSAANAEVDGIVITVIDANNFVYSLPGSYITGLSGLTAGSTYFLDPTTAGSTTVTEPSTAGQISKPILRALSTTTAEFIDYRGIAVAAAAGAATSWSEVTGTSQTAAINSGYITNNAGLVTVTLPTTAALGSIVEIAGKGAGGWKVAQVASQLINFGNKVTTTGTGGSLASTNAFDTLRLLCITANTTFIVLSSVGNITVV